MNSYSATQVFVLILKEWTQSPKRIAFSNTRSFTFAHPFHRCLPLSSLPLYVNPIKRYRIIN